MPHDDAQPRHPENADTGVTAELATVDLQARLPQARRELRDQLPGLEPERHVTDWGRSERVEALVDRTLFGFLYHYWFRVEVEGIDNVPADGGALLLANHAGAIPPDGAMIAKAIKEEHHRPRPIHVATERDLKALPGIGMIITKLGGVSSHPANLQRLLFDESQLVLAFPEGRPATRKPLRERYRLRRFDRSAYVELAMRARVPIVPIAVLGSEEAAPTLLPIRRLPLLPTLPFPAKIRIRFLEPVATDTLGEAPWRDKALTHDLTDEIRALIQENLLEMVAGRRSVWLG
jgi:1-acyl-sn-glycerol-3-phosphate acyltransferase